METRARYVLIGAFTLVCLFGGFGFVYWIKNLGGFGERALYEIRFQQPVSGLVPGANVLFNGIRAGTVTRIDLDADEPKRVTVAISLDPGTPVRADTQVDITYQGFTGAAAVALKGGSAQAPRLTPKDGQPPLLIAGADVGRSLTESAQETLRRIDAILNDNAKPLHTAITGISVFADMLGRNSERVEGLIGGLEKLAGTGAAKQGPTIYDLAAATGFPATEKTIKAQLVVPDPSALILFDSQKILIRSDAGTYTNIDNAQWADNLPKLIQARLVQSFENAHQLGAVSRPLEQLDGGISAGGRNSQLPDHGGSGAARRGRSDRAAGQRQGRGRRLAGVLGQYRGQKCGGAGRGRGAEPSFRAGGRRDCGLDNRGDLTGSRKSGVKLSVNSVNAGVFGAPQRRLLTMHMICSWHSRGR